MNVLIISGHPNLKESVANITILDELQKQLPEAEVRKLDKLYPDYKIDVAAEQEALLKADIIVWQFPLFWYTVPAILKKWVDEVFVHGFAHGSQGKLGGKKFLVSFTTGAPAPAYTGGEDSIADINHLVEMYGSIATLCKLDYQGAMWLNGVSYGNRTNPEDIAQQQKDSAEYAAKLVAKIKG